MVDLFHSPSEEVGVGQFGLEVLAEVIGGLLSGLIVAILVYVAIERRFRLGQERAQRVELARDVLLAVRDELARNQQVVTALRTHLPEGTLPYTAFEVTGWELVSQSPVFTVLDPATTKALLEVYVRLRAANDQHALLLDLTYGPTSTLSFLIAQAAPQDQARQALRRIEERRTDLRNRLVRRVAELDSPLATAAKQVNDKLTEYAGRAR